MKKTFLYSACLALGILTMTMTSCNKDDAKLSNFVLHATTEGNGAKTYLGGTDNLDVLWSSGDAVYVSNGVYGTEYTLTSGASSMSGSFQCEEGTEVYGNKMYAFFPESSYGGFINNEPYVRLPLEQEYDEVNKIKDFPMYGEYTVQEGQSSSNLQFKNLCGVIKIHLQQEGITISKISITTDHRVTGLFPVTVREENNETVYMAQGEKDVHEATATLDCGSGVDITDGKDFYIYLPDGDYNVFRVTMTTPQGLKCIYRINGQAVTAQVRRNHVYTLSVPKSILKFEIGLYSVSATKKVYFAPGNVYYNTYTESWGMFQDQTERHVNGASQNDGTTPNTVYDDYIDYFRQGYNPVWSLDPGMATTQSGNLTITDPNTFGAGTDWGCLFPGEGWYTLTSAEWLYVILSRTNAANLQGYMDVISEDGIPRRCFVLLPDTCSHSLAELDGLRSDPGDHKCSLELLDSYHACVLPYEYYYNNNNNRWEGQNAGDAKGGYWSSTDDYFICVHDDWSNLHSKNESTGQNLMFVRLAHDCPPEQQPHGNENK